MRQWRNIVLAATIGLVSWAVTAPRLHAQSEGDALVAAITSPVDGQQLFGTVAIVGSARHSSAFSSYTLEYDDLSDPAEQWFLVQERVAQQVDGGVLGAWNTDMVPDGSYQLRLRVALTTGEVGEVVVRNLKVANSAPTAVPTPPGAVAAPPDTSGPTPTSPVLQPPSNNLDDNTLAGPVSDTGSQGAAPSLLTETNDSSSARVNFGRVRRAFCTGGYLALAVFGVMLVYLGGRRWLHPPARDETWPQDETGAYR